MNQDGYDVMFFFIIFFPFDLFLFILTADILQLREIFALTYF